MNSYKVLKHGLGYYGYEINDGEINDNEAQLYQAKDVTTIFTNTFPNKSSYTIYREYGRDYFTENLTGEEVQQMYDKLDKSLYLRLYYPYNTDYNILVNKLLSIFESIYKLLLSTDFNISDNDVKVRTIKQLLITLGFDVSIMDSDHIQNIVDNIQNWYTE